jgi:hypothetical protein
VPARVEVGPQHVAGVVAGQPGVLARQSDVDLDHPRVELAICLHDGTDLAEGRPVGLRLGRHVLARQHDEAAAQPHPRTEPGQRRQPAVAFDDPAVHLGAEADEHTGVLDRPAHAVGHVLDRADPEPGGAPHRRTVSQDDPLTGTNPAAGTQRRAP